MPATSDGDEDGSDGRGSNRVDQEGLPFVPKIARRIVEELFSQRG